MFDVHTPRQFQRLILANFQQRFYLQNNRFQTGLTLGARSLYLDQEMLDQVEGLRVDAMQLVASWTKPQQSEWPDQQAKLSTQAVRKQKRVANR